LHIASITKTAVY